jgi:Sensors of blue-light using FAD
MTMSHLYRLAYISSAIYLLPQEDLENILGTSRRNNKADRITGLLLYHDGNFFQFLEGPEDAVLACYRRICNDPRHKGCITLISEATMGRRFADWEMAYVPISELDPADREGFLDLQQFRDAAAMREVEKDKETTAFVDAFLANFRYL